MKNRILSITLSLVLLLVLTACGTAQAEQPAAEPEPPQAQTTTPETAPETAAPQPVSDTVPVAPVENGNIQATPETAEPEPISEPVEADSYTFTDCNETVYATGTVNLRSGPSTDYDKVGSLSSGQSVTRTGIGTGTADGWSRIQTADGSIVYVSSNYLSTAKPAQQQTQTAKPANSSSTTNSSTTSTTTSAQPNFDDRGVGGANGIGVESPSARDTIYAGMTEEEIQEALTQSRRELQFRIEGT